MSRAGVLARGLASMLLVSMIVMSVSADLAKFKVRGLLALSLRRPALTPLDAAGHLSRMQCKPRMRQRSN